MLLRKIIMLRKIDGRGKNGICPGFLGIRFGLGRRYVWHHGIKTIIVYHEPVIVVSFHYINDRIFKQRNIKWMVT